MAHEAGHQLFCHLTGTRVIRVCYFRFGIPPGYVAHEMPDSIWKHILIASGPLFLNTGLGLLAGIAAYQVWIPTAHPLTTTVVLLWLGIAIGMHAFPSIDDANNVMTSIWSRGVGWITRIVATPIASLLYVGAIGSFVWLDVLYGIAVGWALPRYYLNVWHYLIARL
jgi:hypothetical protein